MKSITRLSSGGIIANYQCPAACGHCLYGCSPQAEPGYIDNVTAVRICDNLLRLGCRSVHIGGGEPFLNTDGLVNLIKVITGSGLAIDYIETNAAWITDDDDRTRQILSKVLIAGGNCIMVSADPFHIGFIPFWKPERLIRLLKKTGVPYFIWQERYLSMLRKLDPSKTYDSDDLRNVFGYDVTGQCAYDYGIGFNGRALNLLRKYGKRKPVTTLLESCPELHSTSHFHVDFLGRYIPPGCTGMGILIEDVGKELKPEKYPVVSKLIENGVIALLEYARELGYAPDPEGCVSKCELCFTIRKHLITQDKQGYPDLTPDRFYWQNY